MAGAVASRGVSAQTGTAIPWGPVCPSQREAPVSSLLRPGWEGAGQGQGDTFVWGFG